MNKFLKALLGIIVVLVAVYVIAAFMAPAQPKFEKSIEINVDQATAFYHVNHLPNWIKWGEWFKIDPDAKTEVGPIKSGKDAWYTWDSEHPKVGKGKLTIVESTPNTGIKTRVEFEGQGAGDGYWNFDKVDNKTTKVTWGFTFPLSFMQRPVYYMMKGQMDEMLTTGLGNLKEMAENVPLSRTGEISMTEVESMKVYVVSHTGLKYADMSTKLWDESIGAAVTAIGGVENSTGAPLAIYNKFDRENDQIDIAIGIPASGDYPETDKVKAVMSHSGKAVMASHFGSYESLQQTYGAIMDYIEKNNLEIAGPSWEIYVNDPQEVEITEVQTDIYFPVN